MEMKQANIVSATQITVMKQVRPFQLFVCYSFEQVIIFVFAFNKSLTGPLGIVLLSTVGDEVL